jgi:glycerol kinase
MNVCLAIDQSTSATKAIFFDLKGNVLDKVSRAHRQIYPKPGWVEHDAEEIWQNVLSVTREIVGRNRKTISALGSLSVTNQRETVLVFDRDSGKPLHNALVWQDRRGDAICTLLTKQGHQKNVTAKTGLKIDTYFSASKIKWLVTEKSAIAAKLKSGKAVIGTIDTYLIHRLTKGNVFATDSTNASRTLLFDIRKLCWDESLCQLFRIPVHALPEVRESAVHFGVTDVNGILPCKIPIVGVMGDSQASLFAQRCYRPGMAKATFGTGTSVLLNIGAKFKPSKKGAVTALGYVWKGKPSYAAEGIINFSAATIEWLKNQIGMIRNTSDVQKLAAKVPDNGGVYLVPAFAGLSAPHWNPDARAAILGMTAFTKKEHIVRAAQESIAYQIRDVLDMMRSDAKIKLQNLHADGGPTRDRFLMQFTSDITGVELKVSRVAESSAWGAVLNGLLGLGIYRSLEDLEKMPRRWEIYRPKMDWALAKQFHDGWRAAVKRVL